MLSIDGPMFLLIPGSSKSRVLHPGKVTGLDGTAFLAQFEEAIKIEPGADVVIFAARNGKFFQQGAQVTENSPAEPTAGIRFMRMGDPISADQRQTYRVSTVTSGIVAKVDKESGCPLVDISAEGFAVIVSKAHSIGSMVHVDITHESMRISTPARVQTVKPLPGGKFRHGFLAGEKRSATRKSLEQISNSMQREQLRRMRVCGAA